MRPRRGWSLGQTHGASHTPIHSPTPVAAFRPIGPPTTIGFFRRGGGLTGLASLGLLGTTLQLFVSGMQGVVTAGVVSSLPSPAPSAPAVNVAHLSLLYLCFACGLVGDSNLPPIWYVVWHRATAIRNGWQPSIRT